MLEIKSEINEMEKNSSGSTLSVSSLESPPIIFQSYALFAELTLLERLEEEYRGNYNSWSIVKLKPFDRMDLNDVIVLMD